VEESDLIIKFGLDVVELLPRPSPPKQPQIDYLDPDAIHEGLLDLTAWLGRSLWDAARVRATVDAQRPAIAIPTDGLSAQRVVGVVAARLARESRVTADAGG